MRIDRIDFDRALFVPGKAANVAPTSYSSSDQIWKGWAVEVKGASVFLIAPEPALADQSRHVHELPRVSCRIRYVLDKGETFRDGQPVAKPEPKGGAK